MTQHEAHRNDKNSVHEREPSRVPGLSVSESGDPLSRVKVG
jgi:hypothetical protein